MMNQLNNYVIQEMFNRLDVREHSGAILKINLLSKKTV
ncbi:hypothetical protein BN8_01641 [Fibrisoma limi BUZ 3]|uniref:Uncharacterized protein n=1 Tax=Fibrisoma limi BUZ 3 TaxID=1185876 RepID=I2GFF2_9BACT|nr:hypothetical protein BN8_01641 [Fibrisoma limi BUZ 3]